MILITKSSNQTRYWTNTFFSTLFPISTQVSPVSHMASTAILWFLAHLRPSSALPDPILVPIPVILIPVPISATALASSPVPVPAPIRCSSAGLYPRPRSRPIPARVPVPIQRSFVHLHLRSRSHSCSVSMTVHVPVTVSVPAPDSTPDLDPVRSFLSLGPGYPLGTMRLYRRRALGRELSGARKRHLLLQRW